MKKAEQGKVSNLKIAEDLFNLAYSVKFHQIKTKHPDWDVRQVHEKVMELIEQGCR